MRKMINFTSGTTNVLEICSVLGAMATKKNLEKEFLYRLKRFLAVKNIYLFSGGRTALYFILKSMDIGEGDEVIIEGYTCVAVPKAIMYTGAKPIYVDINLEDYGITLESVQKKITERTKAIVVQHTYGIPCKDIVKIKRICEEKGLYLIEDCAHTMGNSIYGKKLGTIGDASFYSTDHSKYISTSVGGFATTNKKKLARKMDLLYTKIPQLNEKEKKGILFQYVVMNILRNKRVYGLLTKTDLGKKTESIIMGFIYKRKIFYFMDDYSNTEWPDYTFPAKMSEVQINIGTMQMRKINSNKRRREEICNLYMKGLFDEDISNNYSLIDKSEYNNLLRFPILVKDPVAVEKIVSDFLRVEFWFHPPIKCIQRTEFSNFYYNEELYPNAHFAAEHIVNLPIHMKLTNKEVEKICKRLKPYLKENIIDNRFNTVG